MSYLSMSNTYVKTHTFPTESLTRNLLLNDNNKATKVVENNNQISNETDSKLTASIQDVWTKYNFDEANKSPPTTPIISPMRSWSVKATIEDKMQIDEEEEEDNNKEDVNNGDRDKSESPNNLNEKEEVSTPTYHARRPMNAFLIFCKKHRPIVRDKFLNLENRGVTRILGEWWALLTAEEKAPYTELAKEYKDAFLEANPGFKWYKLPAPPLRSQSTRPTTTILSTNKDLTPISSPIANHTIESEFTPGKLADESQLGSLTSLMNNSFSSAITIRNDKEETVGENNNNNNETNSPVNLIKMLTLPPKPIKKRINEQYLDNKNVARDLISDISLVEQNHELSSPNNNNNNIDDDNNVTHQDLINKEVDRIFEKNGGKEVRKSGRQCKGKRYEKFMVEGKLLGNKRDAKLTSQKIDKLDNLELYKPETETPKLDLEHTIKRLAERTNFKYYYCENNNQTNQNMEIDAPDEHNDNNNTSTPTPTPTTTTTTTTTTNSCISDVPNTQNNFNLDLRIKNLPSLSYDVYSQRKKESKKRKCRIKTDFKTKVARNNDSANSQLVGSKKRKNKQSITHLEKKKDEVLLDLIGLTTLAEVAANTQKI